VTLTVTSPIERAVTAVASPLRAFLHAESAGGIVLVGAAVTALVWANSPAADGYIQFWQQKITIGGGQASISLDLRHWVNEALMVLSSSSSAWKSSASWSPVNYATGPPQSCPA
jgi:hypothetical protein